VRKSDMIYTNKNHFFEYDMIGEFNSDGSWIHSKRTIRSYELILVLDGEVFIEEDSVRYTLTKNQMLILEPNKVHFGFKESQKSAVRFYWFHFFTNMPLPFKSYIGSEFYETKQLLKRLLHITNTVGYSKTAVDAAALSVYEELVKIGSNNAISSTMLISRITEYIRINIKNQPSVKGIAEKFGYNPDYIGKLFKTYYPLGLKNYIATQKLKAIKDALLTSSSTIKQIALDFGYNDENAFLKFFTYHERTSPSTFRNTYHNTHINKK
jgi:YesN/AraC family two-component response regulator